MDVGFWQVENSAFSVSKWSSAVNRDPLLLTEALIWVVLRNVPPPLFTFEVLSVIGSAIGDPLYTEKPKLVWNPLGMVKIKVLMELDKKFPSSICVMDTVGNSVIVGAEYLRVPPKCGSCNEFGHLPLRCHITGLKKMPVTVPAVSRVLSRPVLNASKVVTKKKVMVPTPPHSFAFNRSNSLPSEELRQISGMNGPQCQTSVWTVVRRKRKGVATYTSKPHGVDKVVVVPRTKSVPPTSLASTSSGSFTGSSGCRAVVLRRSLHIPPFCARVGSPQEEQSLTFSGFHEKEDGIKHSQSRLRYVDPSLAQVVTPQSARARKRGRKKLPQQLLN